MPDWKRYLRERIPLPPMRGQRDARALQEMADHLEDLYEEARSRGLSEEEAEAHVLRWLGEPERVAEDLTRVEPHRVRARVDRWLDRKEESLAASGRVRAILGDGLRDARTALRGLLRRPVFTSIVVLVLALGIGATSAVFTLVDAILLRPLPFEGADRLVSVHHAAPGVGLADAGQCAAWHFTYEDEAHVFEALGMYATDDASVTGMGDPQAVPVLEVTNGVLLALRLTPAAGRNLAAEDDDPDAPPVVMLGFGYWRSRYAGDPHVVGRTVQVDGVTREIVGVVPAEVRVLGVDPALVVPLRFRRSSLFVGNIGYGAVARLEHGVDPGEAALELNRVLPLAWEKFPGGPVAGLDEASDYRAEVIPLKDDLVGSVAEVLWVLLAGVGIVLLVACANVAGLYLVRAEGKEGEMAVRTAIGASGRRIGWEYFKESLLLGLMGGGAGLVVAHLALKSLMAMAPTNLPRLADVHLGGRVLLFTLVTALGSGLLFGLVPVLRHRRGSLVDTLKEGGRDGSRGRHTRRAHNLLAVGQVALAMVLLVASGLTLRSVRNLRGVDPGFAHPEDVVAVRLYIPTREVPEPARVASIYEAIARRIREVPGVSSVGLATAIPMDGARNVNPFFVQGRDPATQTVSRRHKWIGGDYLRTLDIPLVAGRPITWDDVHDRAPVAMLSERLAREVFGSPEAALGQHVAARPDPPVWKEVVGVVRDVHEDGMDQDPPDLVYWPQVTLGFWQGNAADQVQTWRGAGIAVRGARVGTPGFLDELKEAIWEVSPNLPLQRVRTLPELMSASTARASFTTLLLGVAGAASLALGLVGVYGVIAYGVSRRTRELGMRMALGAARGDVLAMVVRQGVALGGAGVSLGLVLAFTVTRPMASLLYGVQPADPLTFVSVALGLLVVSMGASYLPARRAARVDPAVALRVE